MTTRTIPRHAASPWDVLLSRPSTPDPGASEHLEQDSRPPTKTAQLLQIIEQRRRVPTLALCVEMDMPSMSVWGLLKVPRKTGQVVFDGTHWEIGDNFIPLKVQRAAALLRSEGWEVRRPGESA